MNANKLNRSSTLRVLIFAISLLALPSVSRAYLGGFEQTEGYQSFVFRVQEYNAGQYGPNSGYPTSNVYTPTTTGLWKATSGGLGSSYVTGHRDYDRTWVNSGHANGAGTDQGLVLTTNSQGWSGPALEFRYNLDTQDLGINPASTSGSLIALSFWWCAQLAGPEIGGQLADGYFGDEIEFLGVGSGPGFRLGLTQHASGDTVTYWDGTGMFESSIVAGATQYDRWDIVLNMVNDTFSADYYSFGTNTLHSLVTNAPMMNAMSDFSAMSFRTSPGEGSSKLMSVDDFKFTVAQVAEPGVIPMLSIGAAAWFIGRRRADSRRRLL